MDTTTNAVGGKVLPDLTQLDRSALEALVSGLQHKLAVATKPRKLTLKVSEKGAVSCYGFGKWPVTLYREQWERLIAAKDEIEAFIEAHGDQLSSKA